MKKSAASDIKAILFIAAASVGMAVNIQSFVNTAGLYPGGFSGIALLVQRAAQTFLSVHIPFSLVSYPSGRRTERRCNGFDSGLSDDGRCASVQYFRRHLQRRLCQYLHDVQRFYRWAGYCGQCLRA